MAVQFKRATSIATILSEEGLGFVAAKLGLNRDAGEDNDAGYTELAERLRRLLERLGPLFVKFGQVLSMRRDLLPDEFCDELAKLQAHVAPFDNRLARQIIEAELGRPIDQVFSHVDDLPLAAASLAQVYGAKLLDGTDVVLKVRRPEAVEQIGGDLELLLRMSRQLDRLVPLYRAQQLHRLAQEFAHFAMTEIDFLNEAGAAMRFAKNLAGDPVIRVPRVYRELSTCAMIVLERFDGTRLDQVANAAELAKLGMKAETLAGAMIRTVSEQAFIHGLVHADLHPGNIFILPGGHIGLIDFGMYGELTREMQGGLMRVLMHRVNDRHEEAADALLELYEPGPAADPAGFRREVIEMNKRIMHKSVAEYSVANAMTDESKIAIRYGYCSPGGILLFGRALLVTEGIALKFQPSLQFAECLRPILARVMMRRFDLNRVVGEAMVLLPDLMQHFENLPKVAQRLMAFERRLVSAKSVDDFLAGALGQSKDKRRPREGNGAWITAGLLWIAATIAATHPAPAGAPLLAGVPWFAAVAVLAALAVTGIALFRR